MAVQRLIILIMFAFCAFTLTILAREAPSYDLRALWMAGRFFALGDLENIYAVSDPLFRMEPPAAWIETLNSEGFRGPVYPFIYPPLWAWVMSKLNAFTDVAGIILVMKYVNGLLISAMFWLAARCVRPSFGIPTYMLLGLCISSISLITLLPLEENQPQILVSFLMVLAVERSINGASRTAGAALAIAASIKIYPVLFVLLWIAGRRRSETAAFLVAGAILGGTSVFVAGWPLHVQFLHELSAISRTALVSLASYSADALAGHLFFQDAMIRVSTEVTGGQTSWRVIEKSDLWRLADLAALAGVMIVLMIAAARGLVQQPLFWAAAFIAVSLVGPLSWGYHYLPAYAFLPAVIARLGMARGLVLALILIAPSSRLALMFGLFSDAGKPFAIPLAVAALCMLAIVYLRLAFEAGKPKARAARYPIK